MQREPSKKLHVTSPRETYDRSRHISPETPCPYLPGRMARSEAYFVRTLAPDTYTKLMARGFRRSGHVIYRPRCRGCAACLPLRVDVARFEPTRSMRRVLARGREVSVRWGPPTPTEEKFRMFRRYLEFQHDGTMARTLETFTDFLYDSPTDTIEFTYACGEALVGVGIADRCGDGISSVYMYFDPNRRHLSLGTLSVMKEIEFCRSHRLPYYYLGYYVEGCGAMEYKKRFRPNEILADADEWIPFCE